MKADRIVIYLLIAANLFGFAVGMLTYYFQLAAEPNILLWIFIPDCPLYVLLATLFYFGYLRDDFSRIIISAGLIKYGTWTLFVLLYFSGYFLTDWFGWLLFVEHIGMIAQFVLIAKKFQKIHVLAAIAWFLLNDYVDYSMGLHPFLPSSEFQFAIAAFAIFTTIAVPLALYFFGERVAKNATVAHLRAFLSL